ncbi:MAG: hypothetical protein IPM94_14215 [bacterium]|nr:hypothetical protein [bacterium]
MPPAHSPSSRRRWELWNLQALDPDASAATLAALDAGRRACGDLARRILRDGEGDHGRLRAEARAFLAAHRALHRGLVLGLHLGPYSLIPGLYLDLGLSPVVLLDRAAHDRLRVDADRQRRALGLSGEPEWLVTDRPAFAGRLLRCLREGAPGAGLPGRQQRRRRDGGHARPRPDVPAARPRPARPHRAGPPARPRRLPVHAP